MESLSPTTTHDLTMKYEAVIFDFDGVLMDSGFDGFQWAFEARKNRAEENGWSINWSELAQGIFEPETGQRVKPLLERNSVSWEQLEQMEKAVADRKVEMAANNEIEIFQDSEKILKALEVPAAIVSNAYNEYLGRLLEELGIRNHIDFWIAPGLNDIENYRKRMKPEPAMIKEALENLGAENAVMIGDQIEDVLAARNAGIDSIYIDRDGDTESKADYSVKSLSEALEIIQG